MTDHSTSVLVLCNCFGFRPPIPKKGHSSPLLLGPCLLWPNGRRSQLLLSTCYITGRRFWCANVASPIQYL